MSAATSTDQYMKLITLSQTASYRYTNTIDHSRHPPSSSSSTAAAAAAAAVTTSIRSAAAHAAAGRDRQTRLTTMLPHVIA